MTEVTFVRDGNSLVSFSASGHTGYAPEGEDIVCAALSTLLQAAVFSFSIICEPPPEVRMEKGTMFCSILDVHELFTYEVRAEVQAIMRHTLFAVMNVAASHSNYISLKVENWPTWEEAYNSLQFKRLAEELLSFQS